MIILTLARLIICLVTTVRFFDESFIPEGKLTYSVISARFQDKWIFVRNRLRDTWEICGGHIEDGESPDEAARRELMEETGATEFSMWCIATYSVEKEGNTGYGRLYFAEVTLLSGIPGSSEIAERVLLNELPDRLTYPDIQPWLFGRTLDYLRGKSRI